MDLFNMVAEEWEASDDVKGGALDPVLVKAARDKELKYVHDMGIYEYWSTSDAMNRSGKRPLRLKWIDTDKGGGNLRSRLVCTEVRKPGTEAIFAPTPPLDSMRLVVCKAAERVGKSGKPLTLQLLD